ncbi:MAG: hypothetical protein JRG92_19405 [Deltaproteobacteria bacterium]|nr:hypothetical protein [Deltaproteobacteria bacterium]MBW2696993.1 hypothetical protein [Deltaproteobacteria bacterium]
MNLPHSALDEAFRGELQTHCRLHLAGYKVPRGLVSTTIERTATGKIDYLWALKKTHEMA